MCSILNVRYTCVNSLTFDKMRIKNELINEILKVTNRICKNWVKLIPSSKSKWG